MSADQGQATMRDVENPMPPKMDSTTSSAVLTQASAVSSAGYKIHRQPNSWVTKFRRISDVIDAVSMITSKKMVLRIVTFYTVFSCSINIGTGIEGLERTVEILLLTLSVISAAIFVVIVNATKEAEKRARMLIYNVSFYEHVVNMISIQSLQTSLAPFQRFLIVVRVLYHSFIIILELLKISDPTSKFRAWIDINVLLFAALVLPAVGILIFAYFYFPLFGLDLVLNFFLFLLSVITCTVQDYKYNQFFVTACANCLAKPSIALCNMTSLDAAITNQLEVRDKKKDVLIEELSNRGSVERFLSRMLNA
jgi:hypothetical protein